MQSGDGTPRRVRFGAYEADFRSGEIFRQDHKIKLQGQPFQVLSLLLEQAGEVVTREQLRSRIWPGDTFVDFDQGLNKAILKIREALGDEASKPRFIETLPRRGYRFIATVEPVNGDKRARANGGAEEIAGALIPPFQLRQPVAGESRARIEIDGVLPSRSHWLRWLLVASFAAFVIAILTLDFTRAQAAPSIVGYIRLTEGANIQWGPIGTDGARIYFSAMDDEGRPMIASVSTTGGQIVPVSMPIKMPFLEDVSPDGTKLLVSDLSQGGGEPSSPGKVYYVVPTQGGSARRINIDGNCAGWGAESKHLVYCSYKGTFRVGLDGPFPGTRLSPGGSWPRPSPDGKKLALNGGPTGLIELPTVKFDTHKNPISYQLPSPAADISICCANWTRDGKYLLFEGMPMGSRYRSDIWAVWKERHTFGPETSRFTRLTSGPLTFTSPVPSPDGKHIYAVGTMGRYQIDRLDPKTGRREPFLPQLSTAYQMAFSKDGRYVAYVSYADGSLWRARSDGSDPIQLTSAPIQADSPHWSPGGRYISFNDLAARKVDLIPTQGGAIRQLPTHGSLIPLGQIAWSPKGLKVVCAVWNNTEQNEAMYIIDLNSGEFSKLHGSEGRGALTNPTWSPDGRYIEAFGRGGNMLFDFTTRKWSALTTPYMTIRYFAWSKDGKYIYFTGHRGGTWAIYRVRASDRKLERVMSLNGIQPVEDNGAYDPWFGLAPDGSPLLLTNPGGEEIYSLSFKTP